MKKDRGSSAPEATDKKRFKCSHATDRKKDSAPSATRATEMKKDRGSSAPDAADQAARVSEVDQSGADAKQRKRAKAPSAGHASQDEQSASAQQ